MRNIHELIGIIKGINFDGVVNDLEVLRLQNWVDQNRNLSYDKQQTVMIKMVDEVLADRVITEEERKLLLDYSEQLLHANNNELSGVYELQGIIEGITCDNVLNNQEIIQLRRWLADREYIAKKDEFCRRLYNLVEEILSDGIITEEEQEYLLETLCTKTMENKINVKLNYLRSLVKERQNIGLELIDFLDNEDVLSHIHHKAEQQLEHAIRYNVYFIKDPEIVFISLCLIGMLEYDGNYYDKVRKVYSDLYEEYSEQKIEGTIRTILDRYRTSDEKKANSRIINIALSNAIVPAHFLPAFFEFIYDIYRLNFEFDLPRDMYEDFKFVYEGLRNSLLSEDDSVQVDVTRKSYKLIRTTKQLIVDGKHLDAIIKFSIIIIRLIDKRYWKREEVKVTNPYLLSGYDIWEKSLINDGNGERRHKTTSEFRSRWEPKFRLENQEIYLIPPIHRIKAEYDYSTFKVIVSNNEKVIFSTDKMDVREIMGGYQASIDRIRLEEPLGQIVYQMFAGEEVIYDSRDRLYRKHLVFNDSGNEIANNTDYKGTAIICSSSKVEDREAYFQSTQYYLTACSVEYGDVLSLGDEAFCFSALVRPGIFGTKYNYQYLKGEGAGELLPVFSEIKYLVFESVRDTDKYEILINDQRFRLSDFHYTKSKRTTAWKYVIDLSIDLPGVYRVLVFEYADGKKVQLLRFEFGYDPEFDLQTEVLNASMYRYRVNSSLLNIPWEGELSLDQYNDEYFTVNDHNRVYTYLLPLSLDAYRASGGVWHSTNESLWIDDIDQNTMLEICDSDVDEIVICSENSEELFRTREGEDKVLFRKNGINICVNLGFLQSYKAQHDYVVIGFNQHGERKHTVYCNNRCVMSHKTEFLFNTEDSSLKIKPVFYGKGNVYFEVINQNEEVVFRSVNVHSESVITVPDIQRDITYTIVFYEKGKGLTLKKTREMARYYKTLYAPQSLIDKEFRITKVYYHIPGESELKEYSLSRSCLKLKELNEDGIGYGEVYIPSKREGYRSNLIKPVIVEICSKDVTGRIRVLIERQGKTLTIDTSRNHISDIDADQGYEAEAYEVDFM